MTTLNNKSSKGSLFGQFQNVVIQKKEQKVVKGGTDIIIVEIIDF